MSQCPSSPSPKVCQMTLSSAFISICPFGRQEVRYRRLTESIMHLWRGGWCKNWLFRMKSGMRIFIDQVKICLSYVAHPMWMLGAHAHKIHNWCQTQLRMWLLSAHNHRHLTPLISTPIHFHVKQPCLSITLLNAVFYLGMITPAHLGVTGGSFRAHVYLYAPMK